VASGGRDLYACYRVGWTPWGDQQSQKHEYSGESKGAKSSVMNDAEDALPSRALAGYTGRTVGCSDNST
jgi:hypothetical protein